MRPEDYVDVATPDVAALATGYHNSRTIYGENTCDHHADEYGEAMECLDYAKEILPELNKIGWFVVSRNDIDGPRNRLRAVNEVLGRLGDPEFWTLYDLDKAVEEIDGIIDPENAAPEESGRSS